MSEKVGPYRRSDLGDKLQNISEEEMQAYHKERLKKIRIYYVSAFACGIFSAIAFFTLPLGYGFVSALIGVVLVRYGFYLKEKWMRLYHNLLFLKKERNKTLEEIQPKKPKKFNKNN